MKRITSVGAIIAVLAGPLVLIAPAAANAASAESVYPKSWINRCADVSDTATSTCRYHSGSGRLLPGREAAILF
jgi:hypothetical protein